MKGACEYIIVHSCIWMFFVYENEADVTTGRSYKKEYKHIHTVKERKADKEVRVDGRGEGKSGQRIQC